MPEQSRFEKIISQLPRDKDLSVYDELTRMHFDATLQEMRPLVHKSERRIGRFIFNNRVEELDHDLEGRKFLLTNNELRACINAGVIAGITSTIVWVGEDQLDKESRQIEQL